jgi:hypothetical protein
MGVKIGLFSIFPFSERKDDIEEIFQCQQVHQEKENKNKKPTINPKESPLKCLYVHDILPKTSQKTPLASK